MDNKSTKNWFYNIGAALVVFGILIFTVYLALGWYTKHDVKIPVPNVVGQTVSNAEIMMQNEGLTVKIIDSVYNEKAQPFSIIEQIPAAGNEVKPGRAIYVVINSGNKPKIKMPKLVDQSLTLASAVLKNNGLVFFQVLLLECCCVFRSINRKSIFFSQLHDGCFSNTDRSMPKACGL